jgi:hypothetical protein
MAPGEITDVPALDPDSRAGQIVKAYEKGVAEQTIRAGRRAPWRNPKGRLSMTNDLIDMMSVLEARVAALEAGKVAPKKPAPEAARR